MTWKESKAIRVRNRLKSNFQEDKLIKFEYVQMFVGADLVGFDFIEACYENALSNLSHSPNSKSSPFATSSKTPI